MAGKDLEISAISQVSSALENLDDDARSRVIDWVARRYNVNIAGSSGGADIGRSGGNGSGSGKDSGDGGKDLASEFAVFADLFDAASPRTEIERALVGGYWFQVAQGQVDFAGQSVNDALKDVGHGVSNITNALSKLQNRKPALVRQVAKSGRAQQARKKYKLTTAGVTAVQTMMHGGTGDEGDRD